MNIDHYKKDLDTLLSKGEQLPPPAVPLGAAAGLFRTRHPLGPLEVVCPHPLVLDFGLEPASRLGGLRLVDSAGELARAEHISRF